MCTYCFSRSSPSIKCYKTERTEAISLIFQWVSSDYIELVLSLCNALLNLSPTGEDKISEIRNSIDDISPELVPSMV